MLVEEVDEAAAGAVLDVELAVEAADGVAASELVFAFAESRLSVR